MSSSHRTTSKGGKGKSDKSHKLDKSDTGKGSDKQQIGGGEIVRSKSDDPYIKEKVKQVIEMTHRDENEVCLVLHECEYDVELAVNMLFENKGQSTWETTKKKKNRQASQSKTETTEAAQGDEWNETPAPAEEKQKPRSKSSGGPPRLGRHNDSRGWRGRERQENEKNLEEGGGRPDNRERRGRGGGPRGGGGGRGRGGGRAGGRYPPRGSSRTNSTFNSRPIETWDNSNTWDNSTAANTNHAAEENWDEFPGTDEWSTEEYTGSLADTKVFTPSTVVIEKHPLDTATDPSIASTTGPVDSSGMSATQQLTQALEMRTQMPQQSPMSLNAAQTQYLNQLTQQTSDGMKQQGYGGYGAVPVPQQQQQQYGGYGAQQQGYVSGGGYVYGADQQQQQQQQQQPVRTKTQRARVPPPSKIPASAVEMPGDVNSSISYLDVQFGAMDFMSDGGAIDGVLDSKFGTPNAAALDNTNVAASSNLDLNSTSQNATTLVDAYASSKPNTQSSITSAISQTLSNTDSSIPQTSEHVPNAYNAVASRSSTTSSAAPQSAVAPSPLDLNKQAPEAHSYGNQSTYSSYQPKSSSFQSQTYNSSSYSSTQTTSSTFANPPGNSYVNTNAGTYNAQSASNAYPNSYSSAGSYQSNTTAGGFPSISQGNSYPTNNQTYQQNASQSVYGANTGLNSSSNYASTGTGTSQYNSYNSATNHKLVKDASNYDAGVSATTAASVTNNTSVTSTALSLTQSAGTGTKATTTLAKNSSSVMSNIPPGVTPVMSTPYIQVPFFQTPMYYEDVQLLQQRIPHMTAPYYDMSYQTPTTLTAVRDGALANVAYSISDGRYTRADSNASPVPSTLSQQTSTQQGHQAQPILAAQTPTHPGWIYPSTYNTITPSYQFGVMYQQLPAATNAHGTSNSTGQYPKPTTYASGYGSGYEALTQSTQDYAKGAYVGNTQGQSKASGGNSSSTATAASDLSAMYSKTHATLGKVNSYEKQGFHSGTPPPFTGTLHGNQSAGLAPSGTGYGPQMYIPTMAPHQQHHSTQLIHQPLHQMEVRHQNRRAESGNSSGQRSQVSSQTKSAVKQGYPASYWNQA